MLTHIDDESAGRGVEAHFGSGRGGGSQLELLPVGHAVAEVRSLGVPCGFVNSQGKPCQRLGHVGLKIDGELQYDGERVLVLCDWKACDLGESK
jgi:hypothetical protein